MWETVEWETVGTPIAEDVKPHHVNLLMIGVKVRHYCWVKHFLRLASAQYTGAKIEDA